MSSTENTQYTLKISLLEISPPIWRRLVVPSNITLPPLHKVLQVAMGWKNYHMHSFVVGETLYSDETMVEMSMGMPVVNERGVLLSDIVQKTPHFVYEYDFGDGWQHGIEIEATTPNPENDRTVVCLDGGRAGPPEDSGGPWGYQRILDILKDPKHPDRADTKAWLPARFNPEAFDAGKVSKALKKLAV